MDSSFAQLLKRYRRAAGLTQEELAERAALSVRAISDLERGTRTRPHRDTVDLLASALGLDEERHRALEASISRRRGPSSGLALEPTGLPLGPAPLLGREHDEASVVHMLRSEGLRLVTLVGTGGVGKTQLGLRVAATLAHDFPDGVRFVPLASVHSPSQVVHAIARSLGLQEGGGDSRTQVFSFLRTKELLLLIDNFEHVAAAAPVLPDLLATCPGLTILVTSREHLRLHGEQAWEVLPLAIPEGPVPPPDDLMRYPSVALFVRQARRVKRHFRVTEGNAAAIVEICRRLDGLPLAIELAAARASVLPPPALLTLLDRALPILTGGVRDAPERQRTMRDTIAWSYDLLDEPDKHLFASLSVFVGGCTLQGAAVVSPDGDVLDRLTALTNQHLISAGEDEDDRTRFRMLHVVREYARERLRERGEEELICRRHAAYYVSLADEAEGQLWGGEQATWFRRLDAERGNLQAALEWATDHDPVAALRVAGALWRFWIWHGGYSGWRHVVEAALERGTGAPDPVRARALFAAGWLALHEQDSEAAAAFGKEHVRLAREMGDPLAARDALSILGMAARGQGRPEAAIPIFRETVSICRGLGNMRYLAPSLFNVGLALSDIGQEDEAIAAIEEALDLFRAQGEKYIATTALRALGHICLLKGSLERGRDLYEESLRTSMETGHRTGVAESLEGIAAVDGAAHRDERAVRLLAAATAFRTRVGLAPPAEGEAARVGELVIPEPAVAARDRLGSRRWQEIWEQGEGMTLEDAVAEALAESGRISITTQGR